MTELKKIHTKRNLLSMIIPGFLIITVIVAAILLWAINNNAENDNSVVYSSYAGFVEGRYRGLNYDDTKIDNYVFAAISKKSLCKRVESFEILYVNEDDAKFEYDILLNGLNLNTEYNDVAFREAESLAAYQNALCHVIEDKDYYIMFFIDTQEKISEVKDNFSAFGALESLDYYNTYFFKAIPKSALYDGYEVRVILKNGKVYTLGEQEIIRALG